MFKLDSLCSCGNGQNNKKCFGILGVVIIFLLVVWLGVDINNKIKTGSQIEAKNTITVSATGEVYAKPDLGITTFSVTTEAKTVAEALAENTEKMNAVISSAKDNGVEDKDLKTVGFNIYPRYEWTNSECSVYYCPPGERVLVGYEVYQSLQVKIRDLAKAGTIIEGAAEAGANQISDLQFTIDEQDALKAQARQEAIDEARTKAKELAKELGVKLGRLTDFSEGSAYRYDYTEALMPTAGKGGGTDSLTVETGENKIEISVVLTYEIR